MKINPTPITPLTARFTGPMADIWIEKRSQLLQLNVRERSDLYARLSWAQNTDPEVFKDGIEPLTDELAVLLNAYLELHNDAHIY